VKDAQGNLVLGRTRWRRFAAVLVPAVAAAGVLMAGVATGAVPASFAVSGSTFKVTATHLHGTGFVQYGGVAYPRGGKTITLPDGTVIGDPTDPNNHPIAVSGIADATLNNLCQSVVVVPHQLSLVIHAGQDPNHPVRATNLMIGMTSLSGDATFGNINIGQDASTLSGGPTGAHGLPGGFGQQAETVDIDNLSQIAWSTSAGTFTLNGLDLKVDLHGTECP
jgi:hypothetical protein